MHRADRLAGVTEFAVVVVLDDPRAMPARGIDQREPARDRQHGAGRELVRRRRIDEARRPLAPVVLVGAQPFRVDRHRHDVEVGRLHRGARAAVAGASTHTVSPGFVSNCAHSAIAPCAPSVITICSGSQRTPRVTGWWRAIDSRSAGFAERVAIAEQVAAGAAQRAVDRVAPCVRREMRQRGHARPEALRFAGADAAARRPAARHAGAAAPAVTARPRAYRGGRTAGSLRRRAARRRRPSCCATRRASRPARACRAAACRPASRRRESRRARGAATGAAAKARPACAPAARRAAATAHRRKEGQSSSEHRSVKMSERGVRQVAHGW